MITWSLVPAVVLPIGLIVDRVGVSLTVAASGVLLTLVLAGVAMLGQQARQRVTRPRRRSPGEAFLSLGWAVRQC